MLNMSLRLTEGNKDHELPQIWPRNNVEKIKQMLLCIATLKSNQWR